MMAVCVFAVSSCSDDDDNNVAEMSTNLKGTTWIEQSRYSDGSSYTTTLTFSDNIASFVTEYVDTDGSSFKNPKDDFTYTRSKNMVLFSPTKDGKATLEGIIEEELKMNITNTSNGKVIHTLYRK